MATQVTLDFTASLFPKAKRDDDSVATSDMSEDVDPDDPSYLPQGGLWGDLDHMKVENVERESHLQFAKMLRYCTPMAIGFHLSPTNQNKAWCYCPCASHVGKWRQLCGLSGLFEADPKRICKQKRHPKKDVQGFVQHVKSLMDLSKFHKILWKYLTALYPDREGIAPVPRSPRKKQVTATNQAPSFLLTPGDILEDADLEKQFPLNQPDEDDNSHESPLQSKLASGRKQPRSNNVAKPPPNDPKPTGAERSNEVAERASIAHKTGVNKSDDDSDDRKPPPRPSSTTDRKPGSTSGKDKSDDDSDDRKPPPRPSSTTNRKPGLTSEKKEDAKRSLQPSLGKRGIDRFTEEFHRPAPSRKKKKIIPPIEEVLKSSRHKWNPLSSKEVAPLVAVDRRREGLEFMDPLDVAQSQGMTKEDYPVSQRDRKQAHKALAKLMDVPTPQEANKIRTDLEEAEIPELTKKLERYSRRAEEVLALETDIHQWDAVKALSWVPEAKNASENESSGERKKLKGHYLMQVKRADDQIVTIRPANDWVNANFMKDVLGHVQSWVYRLLRS